MRNYTGVWVAGSSNHKTCNFVDHANRDQHIASMQRLESEHVNARESYLENYPPVVHLLVTLDDGEKAKKI